MNQGPLLERRSPFGIPYALLILTLLFFVLPSAFRAARLSLGKRENDAKDWLPSDFRETAELEWFSQHFVGENFVLATWPGCTSGDQRLKLFEQKLLHECDTYDPTIDAPPELAKSYAMAKELGNELELLRSANDYYNWGGAREKWLCAASGQWYYITPDGHLYRWEESNNGPAAAARALKRSFGTYKLSGKFVTAFGNEPTETTANPFYNDPSLLCASLFHSVRTGDSFVEELAHEGGPLWPVDLTDQERRGVNARRAAMERLTGTMFAPAVPDGFEWTAAAFRAAAQQAHGDQLPPNFDALVDITLQRIIDERFSGSREHLLGATQQQQTDVWYEVFDVAEVEPPPRLTCVLVTLTDLARDNLAHALGRGVLGEQRGRLLQLAYESGVRPPAAPPMAPPPFNRVESEDAGGMPPLRLGGPPVDNVAVDEEGTITLVRLVGYSVVVGIVLSYFCFRSIGITLMIFVVGGTAAMLSMAIVWWTGGHVDAILMSMPSLVYVLGLSSAIHVVNYYRDEVRLRGRRGAPGRALRHALLPCTLASVTTAIGLISLFTSNLTPISNFGLYSAIGVVATLGILFSFLPAALQTFTPKIAGERTTRASGRPPESWLSEAWASTGRWITRHYAVVSVACLAVLLVGAAGLIKIKTSVQLLKLFDPSSRIIHDYTWLETNFGKLVPMEVVVRMPPAIQAEEQPDWVRRPPTEPGGPRVTALDLLERVEAISRIRTVVDRTFGEAGQGIVGQSTGADTFLPPLPDPENNWSPVRSKFNKELLASRDQLRDNDYLRIEQTSPYVGSELWRISLRVAALADVDHGRFIATLGQSVEPVLRAYDTREVLLKSLADPEDGKIKGKPRVLVVGSQQPTRLRDAQLVRDDGSIDGRAAFISTLGELLAGERIRKPMWVELDQEQARQSVAKPTWEKGLKSFDAVVWLGSDGFSKSDFAAANQLIDAEAILSQDVTARLLPGGIPDVEGTESLQAVYTGLVPVVYKAQRTLLYSLGKSIGLAFLLIAAVMITLLNPGHGLGQSLLPGNLFSGFMAGMVAMIPNVFPVLIVFGVMCHLGVAIDIGTMMTASVAMGVAVDDTIHFLAWFREHLDRGMSRIDAVIETYRRVGPAMTQTTIVGGLGLFIFALSTFTPTQRFGTLMLLMLAAALVGDLILLPALLAGPAGRWFKPRLGLDGRPIKADQASEDGPPIPAGAQTPADSGEEPAAAPVPAFKLHLKNKRADPAHRVKFR